MRLIAADAARLDEILDDTYPIWGEGLSRSAYGAWNRAQMTTRWGRDHLRRMALTDGDTAARQREALRLRARVGDERVPALGIGAVFTPEAAARPRPRARADRADAGGRGRARLPLRVCCSRKSDPHTTSRIGFRARAAARWCRSRSSASAARPRRSCDRAKSRILPVIAEISRPLRRGRGFALDRSEELIEFGLDAPAVAAPVSVRPGSGRWSSSSPKKAIARWRTCSSRAGPAASCSRSAAIAIPPARGSAPCFRCWPARAPAEPARR